jgi:hypothetical protein
MTQRGELVQSSREIAIMREIEMFAAVCFRQANVFALVPKQDSFRTERIKRA